MDDNRTMVQAFKQVHAAGGHIQLGCSMNGEIHGYACDVFFNPRHHIEQKLKHKLQEGVNEETFVGTLSDLFLAMQQNRPRLSEEESKEADATHKMHVSCWDEKPDTALFRAVDMFMAAYQTSVTAKFNDELGQ